MVDNMGGAYVELKLVNPTRVVAVNCRQST